MSRNHCLHKHRKTTRKKKIRNKESDRELFSPSANLPFSDRQSPDHCFCKLQKRRGSGTRNSPLPCKHPLSYSVPLARDQRSTKGGDSIKSGTYKPQRQRLRHEGLAMRGECSRRPFLFLSAAARPDGHRRSSRSGSGERTTRSMDARATLHARGWPTPPTCSLL